MTLITTVSKKVPPQGVATVTLSFMVSDVKMAACRHACSSLSLSVSWQVNAEQIHQPTKYQ